MTTVIKVLSTETPCNTVANTFGAEKAFASKHQVEKFADHAGNKNDVYKGTTKLVKYPKADKGGAVALME